MKLYLKYIILHLVSLLSHQQVDQNVFCYIDYVPVLLFYILWVYCRTNRSTRTYSVILTTSLCVLPLSVYPHVSSCLPACSPAFLLACLPARLPACSPAFLLACQPARLPACLPARPPGRSLKTRQQLDLYKICYSGVVLNYVCSPTFWLISYKNKGHFRGTWRLTCICAAIWGVTTQLSSGMTFFFFSRGPRSYFKQWYILCRALIFVGRN